MKDKERKNYKVRRKDKRHSKATMTIEDRELSRFVIYKVSAQRYNPPQMSKEGVHISKDSNGNLTCEN